MGIIATLVLGLIAGALAKLVMPGEQGGGIIVTMLLGVVGAFVGGLVGQMIGWSITGLNFGSIVLAVIGALIVLAIWGFIKGRSARV